MKLPVCVFFFFYLFNMLIISDVLVTVGFLPQSETLGDGYEVVCLEAGAADKAAVYVFLA